MSGNSLLEAGIEGHADMLVGAAHTATFVGSGSVEVLATASMIVLMEKAAGSSVESLVGSERTTVGTHIDMRHIAATPPGVRIDAYSRLIKVDGRLLTFEVWAEDARERIGEGIHERVIIDRDRFLAKVASKAARV